MKGDEYGASLGLLGLVLLLTHARDELIAAVAVLGLAHPVEVDEVQALQRGGGSGFQLDLGLGLGLAVLGPSEMRCTPCRHQRGGGVWGGQGRCAHNA